MKTAEEILKDEFGFIPTAIIGSVYDKVIKAMNTFAQQQVKNNIALADVSKSVDSAKATVCDHCKGESNVHLCDTCYSKAIRIGIKKQTGC